jgi:hypothetical protein
MTITTDELLERVRAALGPADPGIELDEEERGAILDLARVAAHTSERLAAPLTTYIVGAALRDLDPAARAGRIAALASALEDDA